MYSGFGSWLRQDWYCLGNFCLDSSCYSRRGSLAEKGLEGKEGAALWQRQYQISNSRFCVEPLFL